MFFELFNGLMRPFTKHFTQTYGSLDIKKNNSRVFVIGLRLHFQEEVEPNRFESWVCLHETKSYAFPTLSTPPPPLVVLDSQVVRVQTLFQGDRLLRIPVCSCSSCECEFSTLLSPRSYSVQVIPTLCGPLFFSFLFCLKTEIDASHP